MLAVVSLILGAATPLGLTHLRFPDPAISLWGGDVSGTWFQFVRSALVVTGCFWAIAAVFMMVGSLVGVYFDQLPPLSRPTQPTWADPSRA